MPNYHGYAPEQIELMEQARHYDDEAVTPQRKAAWGADEDASTDPADPDELEDEIEQAKNEGEFKSVHVTKTVKVKK
jgi:hypothetical protein